MSDTAPWAPYNVDLIVKWAGTNCELGVPTMDDYNQIRAYVQANPGSGCGNGAGTDCSVPAGQGSAKGYYYHHISLNGPDEMITISGGNANYPDYPDQPHGCYYFMVVNPNASLDKTLSLFWTDQDGMQGVQ
jgi:hypothetical protein